ncbi:MAG: carbohydrate-binding family 9-like protein, partial [Planctomycetales bacterium]|nr:carbohydrate-binding family 9-like protein [Planctomycetales bacterium]
GPTGPSGLTRVACDGGPTGPSGLTRVACDGGPTCHRLVLALFVSCVLVLCWCCSAAPAEDALPRLKVPACDDFDVTGRGDHEAWKKAEWVTLQPRPNAKHDYQSRFKMLYSSRGVYVLFDGVDQRLTATKTEDFADLWKEDVFECFFWTHEDHPVYFEYEISPLGRELPILVPNLNGRFLGWRPWNYDGPRKIKKQVHSRGGAESMAKTTGWSAEVHIPYALLEPLANVPPKPGTQWRANFYRVDYDDDRVTGWDWARVGPSFHDYRRFGVLIFE